MERTRTVPDPIGALERDHLPRPGLDLALHAQQAGHREAPDVRVEDPDHQAAGGQRHGQVDRDGRLADPALARRDGQHPGRGGDRRLRRVSRAFQRARAITAARSSASIAATCTSTERTQSRERTWFTTSRSIWLRNGQEAMVRATSTTTLPPSTLMPRTMPRSTIVSPSSGSTTARRQSRISSSRVARGGSAGDGVDPAGGLIADDCTCVTGNSDPSRPGCWPPPGTDNMGPRPWCTVHLGWWVARRAAQRGGSSDDDVHFRQHREEAGTGDTQ